MLKNEWKKLFQSKFMIVVFNLLSLAVFLYKSRKGETQFKAELIGE